MIKRGKKSTKQKQEVLLDDLYRDVIRKRAMRLSSGCQRCRSKKPSFTYLHTAHMFGRGNGTARWDLRNAAGVCYLCHSYLDSHPVVKMMFFEEHLGKEEFRKLSELAHMTTKEMPVDLDAKEKELRAILEEG